MRSASADAQPIPIPQADAEVDSMRRSMRELQEVCDDDSVYIEHLETSSLKGMTYVVSPGFTQRFVSLRPISPHDGCRLAPIPGLNACRLPGPPACMHTRHM
jgi:hypothetical protein